MAIIDVSPLVMRDVNLTIGGLDDFSKHVDAVTFTPTAASITWTGLNKNTHTDVATATWTVVLNYVQDWDTVGSLSNYLFENEGDTVALSFRPRNGVGPSFTVNAVITPGAIGGTVNTFATTSVTLGCDKPAIVPAV